MANENKQGLRGGRRRGRMSTEKPKDFKNTSKKLLNYLKPYKTIFIFSIILATLSTVFSILNPKILGEMTDTIVKGIESNKGIDFQALGKTALILLSLYIASAIFNYIELWLMSSASQQITYNLRKDIASKISRLPLKYFDSSQRGDVVSRVTNDVETISQNLNQSLVQLLESIIKVIGILIIMLTTSWQLSLIAILILPISFLFVRVIMKKSQKNFEIHQQALGDMDGHIEEMFSNHLIVKSFNGENKSTRKFNSINENLYESNWKSQFLAGLMMPIMSVANNLGYVGVVLVGGRMAISGKITIGDIQAFIQYMSHFTQPITQVANITNILQSTVAAAERIFEFLAEEEEKPEIDVIPAPEHVNGEVVFNHVYFSYNNEEAIIKDFTAYIEPKCNVAIVGPTGAGKTTIVNLLMRFYDIDKGSISIDGIDIDKMSKKDVRQMFGMVLQDTWLFSGTVAENIAFGRPSATREEIIKVAQESYADHFIRTLPNGYNTIIEDSIDNISAGEKQLLTIARALLADPPMLILDEATSSVDTRTEIAIQAAMDKLTDNNKTSFVIAHRLSTIKNADLILVVKDGNIVEQGKHEELLAKNGFYASIYNSQFAE
ncbi:MAG TPA: ABC transporter ATP-binding protein [bacterium]|nr:ABC transporter ATP-binding protein [bacterium]HPO11306.1 ABC transporter ATP-binding protein [bacterium]